MWGVLNSNGRENKLGIGNVFRREVGFDHGLFSILTSI